jgi:iron donor protein CyaY
VAAGPQTPEAWAALAESVIVRLQEALDEAAVEEVEHDRTGDVLTVELGDDMRYVVSVNRDDRRIYVSAEGGGTTFYFQPDDGDWCSEDGRELYAYFAERFGQRTGVELGL